MNKDNFQVDLEKSKSYGDLFVVVKKAVKKVLGQTRSGLLLYLGDLPLNVGAYHQVGSNGIVLNRRVLEIVSRSIKTEVEMNSFVFSLLLHEYLHSLGYLDEAEVKRLVHNICIKIFGEDHPTVTMSLQIPVSKIYPLDMYNRESPPYLKLVKDFERPEKTYIA
ncbi:hypothetical protein KEJ18_04305 [Candidatus Bathyarchaeota archaeon]|nr:hypothetical protein [Candidatus Bathyarchaeota archaeon]